MQEDVLHYSFADARACERHASNALIGAGVGLIVCAFAVAAAGPVFVGLSPLLVALSTQGAASILAGQRLRRQQLFTVALGQASIVLSAAGVLWATSAVGAVVGVMLGDAGGIGPDLSAVLLTMAVLGVPGVLAWMEAQVRIADPGERIFLSMLGSCLALTIGCAGWIALPQLSLSQHGPPGGVLVLGGGALGGLSMAALIWWGAGELYIARQIRTWVQEGRRVRRPKRR